MKKLLVVVVFIVVVFGLQNVFAQPETKPDAKPVAKPAAKQLAEKPAANNDANATVDANDAEDVNQAPHEPNEAEREMMDLEKKFERLDRTAGQEVQEWTKRSTENRVKMMEAVQKQTVAELTLIKNLALEEGATKTAKAVDLLIERRKERYEQMISTAKERQEREAAREEKEKEKERTTRREHKPRRQP